MGEKTESNSIPSWTFILSYNEEKNRNRKVDISAISRSFSNRIDYGLSVKPTFSVTIGTFHNKYKEVKRFLESIRGQFEEKLWNRVVWRNEWSDISYRYFDILRQIKENRQIKQILLVFWKSTTKGSIKTMTKCNFSYFTYLLEMILYPIHSNQGKKSIRQINKYWSIYAQGKGYMKISSFFKFLLDIAFTWCEPCVKDVHNFLQAVHRKMFGNASLKYITKCFANLKYLARASIKPKFEVKIKRRSIYRKRPSSSLGFTHETSDDFDQIDLIVAPTMNGSPKSPGNRKQTIKEPELVIPTRKTQSSRGSRRSKSKLYRLKDRPQSAGRVRGVMRRKKRGTSKTRHSDYSWGKKTRYVINHRGSTMAVKNFTFDPNATKSTKTRERPKYPWNLARKKRRGRKRKGGKNKAGAVYSSSSSSVPSSPSNVKVGSPARKYGNLRSVGGLLTKTNNYMIEDVILERRNKHKGGNCKAQSGNEGTKSSSDGGSARSLFDFLETTGVNVETLGVGERSVRDRYEKFIVNRQKNFEKRKKRRQYVEKNAFEKKFFSGSKLYEHEYKECLATQRRASFIDQFISSWGKKLERESRRFRTVTQPGGPLFKDGKSRVLNGNKLRTNFVIRSPKGKRRRPMSAYPRLMRLADEEAKEEGKGKVPQVGVDELDLMYE